MMLSNSIRVMGAAGPISPNAWGGFFVQAAMKRDLLCDVRFSNRPFGVKRFQTIHQFSVDAA